MTLLDNFRREWLTPEQREEVDDAYLAHIEAAFRAMSPTSLRSTRWLLTRHYYQVPPDQRTPETNPGEPPVLDWLTWLIMGGRGSGKTRPGAEWAIQQALDQPGSRGAIVAPTIATARGVCFEGRSGITTLVDPSALRGGSLDKAYNRSLGELWFANGSYLQSFADEAYDRLRGPGFDWAWCDEIAAWRYGMPTWDNLKFALRESEYPRVVATTTPRPTALVLMLTSDPEVVITGGTTYDNARNLSSRFLNEMARKYAGTRLGRQELLGMLLTDVPGALFKRANVGALRLNKMPTTVRRVVAIDPAWSGQGDETGIIVVGMGPTPEADKYAEFREAANLPSPDFAHAFILADFSGLYEPAGWREKAVDAFDQWNCEGFVAEADRGGKTVPVVLETVERLKGRKPRIEMITPKESKYDRANPVSALAHDGRLHMVGEFPTLEDQMCFVAGTLIETQRGHVPIEQVDSLDLVLTRAGWAPVHWAGQTGWASEITRVEHQEGGVSCTPWHRVWTADRGFVPANSVGLSDRLLVRPSPANTAPPSLGADAGGIEWSPATTGTPEVSSFIGRSGKPITARYLQATSSTTVTKTPETIISGTSKRSLTQNIDRFMAALLVGRRGLQSSDRRVSASSGNAKSHPLMSANTAANRSRAHAPALDGVAADAGANIEGTEQPVYDITVSDGWLPEFFANGVLVHNCTWVPFLENGKPNPVSPDRMDGMVHGVRFLLIDERGAGTRTGASQFEEMMGG